MGAPNVTSRSVAHSVLVVDASALVASLLATTDSGPITEQLVDEELHAPALLVFEVLSALRGLCLGGRLTEERAEGAITDMLDLDVRNWAPDAPMARRILELRHNLSSYDASYLALAELLACPLLTRDRRFATTARRHVEVLGC